MKLQNFRLWQSKIDSLIFCRFPGDWGDWSCPSGSKGLQGWKQWPFLGWSMGSMGLEGKLETMEPRMPLPGYLYNNIWHSHGIDGPNRNRLFTVLKNGDFPWQTGNAITRCYHEIRTFPKGWLLCSPNIWSAQKPTNSEMGYELSGASNIPWETMGKTMGNPQNFMICEWRNWELTFCELEDSHRNNWFTQLYK